MLRTGASRSILRSLNTSSTSTFKASSTPVRQQFRLQLCTLSRRPQSIAFAKPLVPKTQIVARWASGSDRPLASQIDKKREKEIGQKKLQPTPETISVDSSTVASADAAAKAAAHEEEPEMMSAITSDLQTIRDTFDLSEVPTRAYYMGLAGVIPYAATSLGTVYCAYEINQAADYGTGVFVSGQTAEQLLHIIEPLQVGYGAVILSFLGAIHWGLEWAEYNGEKGYPRYAIGVISTAVAWPTLLLPVEYALITQFLAFNFLYYTDVRAKTRGWAPPWYGIYRFVLTFIVGGSIVISLIGRGQIADQIGHQPSPADRIRNFTYGSSAEGLEETEEKRREFLPTEEEDMAEDEDEDEDEDEE